MCLNVFPNDFLLLCYYICIPFICVCLPLAYFLFVSVFAAVGDNGE